MKRISTSCNSWNRTRLKSKDQAIFPPNQNMRKKPPHQSHRVIKKIIRISSQKRFQNTNRGSLKNWTNKEKKMNKGDWRNWKRSKRGKIEDSKNKKNRLKFLKIKIPMLTLKNPLRPMRKRWEETNHPRISTKNKIMTARCQTMLEWFLMMIFKFTMYRSTTRTHYKTSITPQLLVHPAHLNKENNSKMLHILIMMWQLINNR